MNVEDIIKGHDYAVRIPDDYEPDRLYEATVLGFGWKNRDPWYTGVGVDADGSGILVMNQYEDRLEVCQPEDFVCTWAAHRLVEQWLDAEKKWTGNQPRITYQQHSAAITKDLAQVLNNYGLRATTIKLQPWHPEVLIGLAMSTTTVEELA